MLRIDILKACNSIPDLRKVSQLVKRDGPITYQLLRLVNSPLWAMRQKVDSDRGRAERGRRRCFSPHCHNGYC